MFYRKIPGGFLIRLKKNEEIVTELTNFCEEQNVQAGFIHGLGAVQSAEIGFYHLNKQEYEFKNIDEDLEIVSLHGNVSLVGGKPFFHLHGVFSDEKLKCYGGHLKSAIIGGTGEFRLEVFEEPISRVHNDEVGLKLLDL